MLIRCTSVVIQIINQFNIAIVEPENYTPAPADGDGPILRQIPLERMQPPTGNVYVARRRRTIQKVQGAGEPFGMICRDTSG